MEKFILRKEDTVLLIIDIQDRLAKVMEYKDKVIRNTQILISTAQEMDIPIIVTEQYPKGLGHTVVELQEGLEKAQIFSKNSFTACTSEVMEALEKINKKKILIVGMETHVCVYQTVRELLAKGYEIFVAKDGVASRSTENYLNGLELMKSMGAVITNTETIAFDLLKTADTPEFKFISKLIK